MIAALVFPAWFVPTSIFGPVALGSLEYRFDRFDVLGWLAAIVVRALAEVDLR